MTLATSGSTHHGLISPAQYNLIGITANGGRVSGGLDGQGNALSAALLSTSPNLEWRRHTITPPGSKQR